VGAIVVGDVVDVGLVGCAAVTCTVVGAVVCVVVADPQDVITSTRAIRQLATTHDILFLISLLLLLLLKSYPYNIEPTTDIFLFIIRMRFLYDMRIWLTLPPRS
jgi:hypothetical protein